MDGTGVIWGDSCFCRSQWRSVSIKESPQKDVSAFDTEPEESSWMQMLSIETGGIQRVTEEERLVNTTKWWNACTFWYALFRWP